jgi:hypothetical protein
VSEICVLERDRSGLVRADPAIVFGVDGSTHLGPGSRRLDRLLDR